MTKVIVETQPLNKASSEAREICNPGIWAGIPGRDGQLTLESQPQSQTHQAQAGAPPQCPRNGFTSCPGDTALGKT